MRKGLAFGAVAAAGLLFAWGYVAHRNHVFPYALLRAIRGDGGGRNPRREMDRPPPDTDSLVGLPYVGGMPVPAAAPSGVLVHDRQAAFPGLNLYCSWEASRAALLDMDGRTVHEWSLESAKWTHVAALRDGSLLAMENERGLVKLDRDSRVRWRFPARAHHYFSLAPDGSILLLSRRTVAVPEIHRKFPIVADEVLVLDPSGREKRRISLLDPFLHPRYAFLLPSVGHRDFTGPDPAGTPPELDILHANHVEVLDGRHADRSPLYAAGNLLVCLRTLDLVAILDGRTSEILWLWGISTLQRPHHPTMLPDGHVLLFNNGVAESETLEVDPMSGRVVWSCRPGPEFFTRTRGAAQRLPNGNTLLTESEKGLVREVDPGGRVVWSFANPDRNAKGERLSLRKMTRYAKGDLPF